MEKTKLMKQVGMVVVAVTIIASLFLAGIFLKILVNIFLAGWRLV